MVQNFPVHFVIAIIVASSCKSHRPCRTRLRRLPPRSQAAANAKAEEAYTRASARL